MLSENLHFKIGLAGTYWNNKPMYSILINNTLIVSDEIAVANDEIFYVEFDADVPEGTTRLTVRLENKTDVDTVENEDKTAILKDMLLHIRSVEIDEINLGNFIYTKSLFVGDDSSRPVLDKCIDLGWNGAWTLEFESPFYIWLLENI